MIPVSYSVRNLYSHRLTTILTVLGIGLVVFVFAATNMLSDGLKKTMVSTGSDDNVIVIRKASQTEVQSIIDLEQASVISAFPEIAPASDGTPLFTKEIYVLINIPKRKSGDKSNVVVRGVSDKSMQLRPDVKLAQGRMWNPGTSEIIAGKAAAERFQGCGIGEKVRFGARDWTVVGIFDGKGTGFDSELWGDIEQMMDAFRRPVYSSLTFRLADQNQFETIRERVENDPRLPLDVKREKTYYAEQSRATSQFIGLMGSVISFVFSLGAIIGAMITMYAAVANRTKEIGTLRSLGFSRFSILTSFMLESILIAVAGGIVGVLTASLLQFVQISTTNWDTFSELAFNFGLNSSIVISSLIFAAVMGVLGGFLPAVRASRLKIVDSLRAI
ncbi:MAG: ABC transporter permease [candidate division Zixibacteria bacterium]|nr:ABC transporter permease [candidate division Zixibacteria bacterium]